MAEKQTGSSSNITLTLQNEGHQFMLLHRMNTFRKEKKACDLVLEVGEDTFDCHLNVVAASSLYFDRELIENTPEKQLNARSDSQRLDISNLCSKTSFIYILDFIYTGKIQVPFDNIETFLKESKVFEIESLQAAIDAAFSADILTDANAAEMLLFSYYMQIITLKELVIPYVCEHFQEVSSNPKLLEISFEILKDVLDRDAVNVESEEEVLDFVLLWADHWPSKRVPQLTEALNLIRLGFIPGPKATKLIRHPLVTRSPGALGLAADLMDYHFGEEETKKLLPEKALEPRTSYAYPNFDGSKILPKDSKDLKTFLTLLGEVATKESRWEKCFVASDHDYEASAFHQHCDKKGPTITLVSVNGNIFGGYTDANWDADRDQTYEKSTSSFLFSVSKNIKMKVKDRLRSIKNSNTCGPIFGDGNDLFINGVRTNSSNLGSAYQLPPGYSYGSHEAQSLLAGEYEFVVEEYEVFYDANAFNANVDKF